ncbi:hypothetical protein BDP55DRAFT_675766 [Colletotrichum godetiae]|uniref:Uncharacterized protein n=1 Tax=Colletotrichum godetiae TaxID=1209918 RepID=A0AAJ0ETR1_9PEZI|nr:uncharacterized protein BDP55DRAFT_675766 [Colletotrichum godetiae]KAK1671499.1 hypothetical protein BDP55DRAFT_675766 [Colletotrichum godetiae]
MRAIPASRLVWFLVSLGVGTFLAPCRFVFLSVWGKSIQPQGFFSSWCFERQLPVNHFRNANLLFLPSSCL